MNLIKQKPYLFFPGILIRDTLSKRVFFNKLSKEFSNCIKTLRRDGVAVAPFSWDNKLTRNSLQKIESLMCDSKKFGSDFRYFDIQTKSDEIFNTFSFNPEIMSLARAYMRLNPNLDTTLGAKLTYEKDNLGSGQGWHRDSYTPQFKAMVYLTDVDKQNGPFEYVSQSHKYSHIWQSIKDNTYNKKYANNSRFTHEEVIEFCRRRSLQRRVFEGQSGTIILFDSRGLHRGSPIHGGLRYALTNYYT